MHTILNYGVAFFQVVILNCVQPVNWNSCSQVDQWLIPGLREGWDLYTGKVTPYEEERNIIQGINTNIPDQ